MFKLSPEQRARRREQKARQRANQTEEQKHAQRQACRAHHAKNRGQLNAQRIARAHRRKLHKPKNPEHDLWVAGLSIVSRESLKRNDSIFTIRQTRYQTKIERLANEILEEKITIEKAHERAGEIDLAYRAARERANRWQTTQRHNTPKPKP
jgi:hypothetical protein